MSHSPLSRRGSQGRLGRRLSVLVLLAAAGCSQPDLATSPVGATAEALLAKPTSSIPLAFTVSDGPGYRIRSDGLGEYVHGQETVSAELDGYGNLQISVASALPPLRMLTFDYSVPADPSNNYRPNLAGTRWFRIKSNKANNGNPGIHELAVGSDRCYNVTVAHGDLATQHVDGFNTAADPQSTYVLITRTGSSTWSMTTGTGCSGLPDIASLYSQDVSRRNQPRVFRGYFSLPFAIAIRSVGPA